MANALTEDAFGHWLAGFTAGEGCFHVYAGMRSHGATQGYCNVTVSFAIKLRSDDAPVLHRIHEWMGCGAVQRSRAYRGSHEQTTFSVTKVADLHNRVVPVFERYPLRGRKALDFEIWRQAVELLFEIQQRPAQAASKKGGSTRWLAADRKRIQEMAASLKAARAWRTL